MTYEELMASIDATAAERKREIIEQAKTEAEKIRKAALARAAVIRDEALTETKRRLAQERQKALGQVREEGKIEILRRRNGIADRAFEAAGSRVLTLRASPDYREWRGASPRRP